MPSISTEAKSSTLVGYITDNCAPKKLDVRQKVFLCPTISFGSEVYEEAGLAAQIEDQT